MRVLRLKEPRVVLAENYVTADDMGFHTSLYLPMEGRIRSGMESKCDHCNEEITTDKFFCIITEKTKNYMFHPQCYSSVCWDEKIYQNGNPSCKTCDHAYDRHFDGYEDAADPEGFFFAGCKYCGCGEWMPPDDFKLPKYAHAKDADSSKEEDGFNDILSVLDTPEANKED